MWAIAAPASAASSALDKTYIYQTTDMQDYTEELRAAVPYDEVL